MSHLADVINKAADLIDERGLWKSNVAEYLPNGPLCVVLALDEVAGPIREFGKAIDLMDARVGGDLIGWNDAPERTKDEVVAMMRSVAAEVTS